MNLLYSLIPILLILYYFFLIKKYGMSNYAHFLIQKKTGSNCFKCCEKLHNKNYKLSLCKSCERDISVDRVLNHRKFLMSKFDELFFNKNFENLQSFILYLSVGSIILTILMSLFQVDISTIYTNTLLSIYWSLTTYRLKLVMNGYKKSSHNDNERI